MSERVYSVEHYTLGINGSFAKAYREWPEAQKHSLENIWAMLESHEYESKTTELFRDLLIETSDEEIFLLVEKKDNNKRIIGHAKYALAHRMGAPHGIIYDVMLLPEFWKRGIAKTMIDQVLLHSKKSPPTPGTKFYYEAPVPKNLPRAQSLFKRLGFEKVDPGERIDFIYRLKEQRK